MSKWFPHSEIKNVRLFYLLSIFTNGWFFNSNWIFLAMVFMNQSQLAVMDALSLAIGTAVDLPSGAIADIVGRKKTIVFSRFIFFFSMILFVFSFNFMSFFIANILFWVAISFYGGADQAFLYDSLKAVGKEEGYLHVTVNMTILQRITTLLAAFLGAAAFAINIRYPFILVGIFGFIAWIVTLFLDEVKIYEKHTFSFQRFFQQQWIGINQLLQGKLLKYAWLFFIILGIQYMYDWGVLRGLLAIHFGFSGSQLTALFGVLSFIVGMSSLFLPKLIKKSSDYKVSILLSLLFVVGLLSASFYIHSLILGTLVLGLIALPGGLFSILSQKIVNDECPSELRATVLSALSLLIKLPYILMAFFIGLSAQNNQMPLLMGILCICAIIAIGISFLLNKKTYEKVAY